MHLAGQEGLRTVALINRDDDDVVVPVQRVFEVYRETMDEGNMTSRCIRSLCFWNPAVCNNVPLALYSGGQAFSRMISLSFCISHLPPR
jgi:hypothetical protein